MVMYKNNIYYNYYDNRWRKHIRKSKMEDVINLGFEIKNNFYIETIKLIL